MNNRIFIAMPIGNDALLDDLRIRLEDWYFFDRYGDAEMSEKYGHFGFTSVAPAVKKGCARWFWRFLRCSYVYFPSGWHESEVSRRCFAWAEFMNKHIIFGEDCR